MSLKTQNKQEIRTGWEWHVRRRCDNARQLEMAGDYDSARAALACVWNKIGERPTLEKLAEDTQAEVLLRVGALSSRLGSVRQISGAQEFAKDLLAESQRRFEQLGDQDKVSDALRDLALCYWREGALEEGRVLFRESRSNAISPINRLKAMIDSTTVEISSGHYQEALYFLDQAKPLLEQADDAYISSYHIQLGLVHRKLDDVDTALIEYSAASLHLELAGHKRYLGIVENNVGFILFELGRYEEALTHFEKARAIFVRLKDTGHVAQVNDARARVFIAQRRYSEAERVAFAAVATLEQGGEQSLLAESLITYGIVLARIGRNSEAQASFLRAIEVADLAGDLNSSANSYLAMIEELHQWLSSSKVLQLLREANQRLGEKLEASTIAALRRCIILVLDLFGKDTGSIEDMLIGGSLADELLHFEGLLIKRALDQADGSVTRAARLLGMTHQGLAWSLSHRHKQLLRWRKPSRRRHESIIKR